MIMADILRSRRHRPDRATLKQTYRSVFSSEAGLVVLEDLCACLERVRPPCREHGNMADARAFHDGECSVALRILVMLGE